MLPWAQYPSQSGNLTELCICHSTSRAEIYPSVIGFAREDEYYYVFGNFPYRKGVRQAAPLGALAGTPLLAQPRFPDRKCELLRVHPLRPERAEM